MRLGHDIVLWYGVTDVSEELTASVFRSCLMRCSPVAGYLVYSEETEVMITPCIYAQRDDDS
jgi:hypothetical protein